MISPNNKEIRLTISKAQADWLENLCKKAGISKSRYISWCLAKKAEELLKVLNLNSQLGNYQKDQIAEIIKTEGEDFFTMSDDDFRKKYINY